MTIDSDSVRSWMPAVPLVLPVSSWVRKARRDPSSGQVLGTIPVPRLPAHLAQTDLAADGGGFVAMRRWNGRYPFTLIQFVDWLRGWQPAWAAMLDECVERAIAPSLIEIKRRQDATTDRAYATWQQYWTEPWCWVPTVQGWTVADYVRHARKLRPLIDEQITHYGSKRPYRVGVGTLCGRTRQREIVAIVEAVAYELPDVPLHLWGVKLATFRGRFALPSTVVSADTAAWNGRFGRGIEAYRRSGLPQRRYAYDVALPAYREKLALAQAYPTQRSMLLGGEIVAWERLSSTRQPLALAPCPCGYRTPPSYLDDEEHTQLAALLAANVCPLCLASRGRCGPVSVP